MTQAPILHIGMEEQQTLNPGKIEGPRGARPEELEKVWGLINAVFRPQTRSMHLEHSYMYGERNADNLRIMLDDGIPVSHYGTIIWNINVNGIVLKMACVGAVCTDEAHRGKGYATELLKDAEENFRAQSVDIVFISGPRGLYTRNGYSPAGLSRIFTVTGEAAQRIETSGYEIRPMENSDYELAGRLYDAKDVRYERSPEELPALIEDRLENEKPDRFFMVGFQGRDTAYFVLNPKRSPIALWEYAGDTDAVVAGVALAMKKYEVSLTAHLPFHDVALTAALRALGLAEDIDTICSHTIKILDFQNFMDKMLPLFAQRLDAVTLSRIRFENRAKGGLIICGDEEYILEEGDAVAKLVFSCPEYQRSGPPHAPGVIGEFIKRALPVPFVWPGINYV